MRHRAVEEDGCFCTRRGSGYGERDEDAEADREESIESTSFVSLVVISKRRSSFPRGYEWVSLSF